MKFKYSNHFLEQIKDRRITKKLAKRIYFEADEKYFDTYTNHNIAVSNVQFHGKARKIMVAYDIIEDEVHFITSYPVGEKEISNRLARKRWIYEKN